MARLFDDSLYEGAAEHYLAGRFAYPQTLVDAIADTVGLVRTKTVLDLGCGPGSLTLRLAPRSGPVLAVDADADMIRVGRAEAERCGVAGIEWRHTTAEDLELPDASVDVVVLAQSFHWMDRPLVAARIRRWLAPGGWCVHVGATTHEGDGEEDGLHYPSPPREAIAELVRRYLGPHRRAGQGTIVATAAGEDAIFAAAGLHGPLTVDIPGGEVHVRTVHQVVAATLSLSSSAPHLFGDRLDDFVADLKDVLNSAAPDGRFAERQGDMRLRCWR